MIHMKLSGYSFNFEITHTVSEMWAHEIKSTLHCCHYKGLLLSLHVTMPACYLNFYFLQSAKSPCAITTEVYSKLMKITLSKKCSLYGLLFFSASFPHILVAIDVGWTVGSFGCVRNSLPVPCFVLDEFHPVPFSGSPSNRSMFS